jgi:hypothetical protein
MNEEPKEPSVIAESRSLWQAEYGPIFWAHLAVISFAWLSPLLLPWKFVAIGVGMFYLQMLLFGACVLTMMQFGSHMDTRKRVFIAHYLNKLGFDLDPRAVSWFHDTVVPVSILALALVIQLGFGLTPMLA